MVTAGAVKAGSGVALGHRTQGGGGADQVTGISHQRRLQLGDGLDVRLVAAIHHSDRSGILAVLEVVLEVAAAHPAGKLGDGHHSSLGSLGGVGIHIALGVEVAVGHGGIPLIGHGGGDLLGAGLGHVGVVVIVGGGVGNELISPSQHVVVGLDHAALFTSAAIAGEDSPGAVGVHRVAALPGGQHGPLAAAEVVALHKGVGLIDRAHAVFVVAVIVVIIDVYVGGVAQTGMAGIGVVKPVVVEGQIILGLGGAAAHQVALAVVPEVVIGDGEIVEVCARDVQSAVALDLVALHVRERRAVEEVAVVDPTAAAARDLQTVAVHRAAGQHEAQIADLQLGRIHEDLTIIYGSVVSHALHGHTRLGLHRAVAQVNGAQNADDLDAAVVNGGSQLRLVGSIGHLGPGGQGAVGVIGAWGAVGKAVARAVVGLDGDGTGDHGGGLVPVGHHLQLIAALGQTQGVHTHIAGILPDQLLVQLGPVLRPVGGHKSSISGTLGHVGQGPLRIGGLKPAAHGIKFTLLRAADRAHALIVPGVGLLGNGLGLLIAAGGAGAGLRARLLAAGLLGDGPIAPNVGAVALLIRIVGHRAARGGALVPVVGLALGPAGAPGMGMVRGRGGRGGGGGVTGINRNRNSTRCRGARKNGGARCGGCSKLYTVAPICLRISTHKHTLGISCPGPCSDLAVGDRHVTVPVQYIIMNITIINSKTKFTVRGSRRAGTSRPHQRSVSRLRVFLSGGSRTSVRLRVAA